MARSYEWRVLRYQLRFNSLSPGKCLASCVCRRRRRVDRKFQFPLTGKVLGKLRGKRICTGQKTGSFNSLQTGKCLARTITGLAQLSFRVQVSIPSKRESAWQVRDSGLSSSLSLQNSFNSLQTGKCLASHFFSENHAGEKSFNSLQTGKCFARNCIIFSDPKWEVEFQFPPNGKVLCKLNVPGDKLPSDEFQFPPNGKVLCKSDSRIASKLNISVFQFPPNGKVLCKLVEVPHPHKDEYVIGFQFPPNGKVLGKDFDIFYCDVCSDEMFQFPPNGKVLGK